MKRMGRCCGNCETCAASKAAHASGEKQEPHGKFLQRAEQTKQSDFEEPIAKCGFAVGALKFEVTTVTTIGSVATSVLSPSW